MAQFPDVQAKAQAQLDEVLGHTLPTFDEMETLPYVTALVWELLRYYVVAPIGSAPFICECNPRDSSSV